MIVFIDLEEYSQSLKSQASCVVPTRTSSIDRYWPPASTNEYICLILVKFSDPAKTELCENFNMSYTDKFVDTVRTLPSVKVENIFHTCSADKRKIVLVEGVVGSGKTTLSVYILQQWGMGKLFQEYKAVIYVPLHDEKIQKSQEIEELLSEHNQAATPHEAISLISEKDGENVLFLLDGWNDLPISAQENSLFLRLLQGKPGQPKEKYLHKSSIIITSRPISSCALYPIVSSRVQILGFGDDELKKYFIECLVDDKKESTADFLISKIKEYPELLSSCCIPLNASILVHIYNCSQGKILDSRYGIFSEIALTYIYQYYLKKQKRKLSLKSFDDLPEDILEKFMMICDFAFKGVIEGSTTFVFPNQDVTTLDLWQGFSMSGSTVCFKFIHQTFQELFAAYYMSKQSPSEQLHNFDKLLRDCRFIPVLQFYAAMSQLQNPDISDLVLKTVSQTTRNDDKSILLHAIYCLCEIPRSTIFECFKSELKKTGLGLGNQESSVLLTPADSFCVGRFLSYICNSEKVCGKMDISLINCNVDDKVCQYLVHGIMKYASETRMPNMQLDMNLDYNNIHEEGASNILNILKEGYLYQVQLSQNCNLTDEGGIYFAEGILYNNLAKLVLSACGLTQKSVKCIAESLKNNTSLLLLDISLNEILNEGATYLSESLKINKTLTELNVENCGITNEGMKCIGESLLTNNSLECLILSNIVDFPVLNDISEDGLMFIAGLLKSNVALKLVEVSLTAQTLQRIKNSGTINMISGLARLQLKCKRVWLVAIMIVLLLTCVIV